MQIAQIVQLQVPTRSDQPEQQVSMTSAARTSPRSDSSAEPRVSVLVISFNTKDMTIECLRSVMEQTLHHSFEVIVVDNQSSDGSADAIAVEFPEISLIRSDENLGFARACNVAAAHARGEFLLLLNPDTVVLDHAIDRLIDFAHSEPEAGIWGGRTLFGDRSLNPTSCWGQITLWSLLSSAIGLKALFPGSELFNSEGYGRWKRDSDRHVDIVTGCLLLIRRVMWQRLNGFKPEYFMYGEEADLCLRARKLGARPMITPRSTIVHYGSASDTYRPGKLVRVLAARITLVRQHWGPVRRRLAEVLFLASPLIRATAYSVAAAVVPTTSLVRNAAQWREVWRRRNEWYPGYPSA